MNTGVEYTLEFATAICARLADGESLKTICAAEGMPDRSTVYRWLSTRPDFLTMYRAAREEHADAEFDRLTDLVNEEPKRDANGRVDLGWVQQQRLKVDTLKWQLARMAPKKYSERFEVTGAEGVPLMPDGGGPTDWLASARRLAFILRLGADTAQSAGQSAPLLLENKPIHRVDRWGHSVEYRADDDIMRR
jgi:hypothetical protein